MEQNAYLNFLEKEAKPKKNGKTSKKWYLRKKQTSWHENKTKKNLYLQDIIEAYNPYKQFKACKLLWVMRKLKAGIVNPI